MNNNIPVDPKNFTVKNLTQEWAIKYSAGEFYLIGDNPITKSGLWPWLSETAAREGKVAWVRKKDKEGKNLFLVASLPNLDDRIITFEEIEFSFRNREGQEIFTEKNLDPADFVILYNDKKGTADLIGSDKILNHLDQIAKGTVFDYEISRPRFIIETAQYLNEVQKKKIRESFDAHNVVTFVSLGDGRPMTTHTWNVESKINNLIKAEEAHFNKFCRLNGIKYNTAKKDEQMTVREVRMVEEQFDQPRLLKQQERERFLRECFEKFGGWDYTLLCDGKAVFKEGERWVIAQKIEEFKIKKELLEAEKEYKTLKLTKTEKEENNEKKLFSEK